MIRWGRSFLILNECHFALSVSGTVGENGTATGWIQKGARKSPEMIVDIFVRGIFVMPGQS